MNAPFADSRHPWFGLGTQAGAASTERRVGAVMLALGAFAMVLVLGLAGVLVGTYLERAERGDARFPTAFFTDPETTDQGARWRISSEPVGDEWTELIYIEPGEDAVLPPGLAAWPRPGHLVLAPGLSGTPSGQELIARFGPAEPEPIGMDGVLSSTERIAYYRPTAAELPHFFGYPMVGYGTPGGGSVLDSGAFGGIGYQWSFDRALIGFAVAFLVPALLLMAVASRAGSAPRDERLQILRVLGASPRQQAAVLLGAVLRPLVAGGVLAALALACMAVTDVRVPWTGFEIRADDIRAHLFLIGAAAGIGWAMALGIVLVSNRLRRARSTRPRPVPGPERAWKLLPLPLAVATAALLLLWTLSWEDSSPRILIIYAGIILISAALPSFIGAATTVTARALARAGNRLGSAALIVAGRQLLHEPRAARRLASGMALLIVLVAQMMMLSTMVNSQTREAISANSVIGRSALQVSLAQDGAAEAASVRHAVAGRAELLAVRDEWRERESGEAEQLPTSVIGQCPALQALSLPCTSGIVDQRELVRDPRVAVLVPSVGVVPTRIVVADPVQSHRDDDSMFLVAASGASIPVDAIQRSLRQDRILGPDVRRVGEEALVGLSASRENSRWHVVGAAAATILVGLAITGAVLADTPVQAARSGVLSLWGARGRFATAVVAGRILLPLLIAVATGGAIAQIVTWPLRMPPLNGQIPDGFATATVVLPVLAALAMTILGAMAQARHLRTWRAGHD